MSDGRIHAAAFLLFALVAGARAGELEDAAALRAQGRLDDAIAKLETAAKADPANAAVALGLSETLLASKRSDEAAAAVDAALAKDPASVPLMLAKVRALVAATDAAANRRTVDVAVRPEVVAKSTEARKWVDLLLAQDKQSVPGRVLDARIARYEQGEETADVRQRMERVVADAPTDADANFQLGMLLFRAGGRNSGDKATWAAAEKCFRAAFAAEPTQGQALLNAALCAAWQGRYDTYVPDLERAAELMPGEDGPLSSITKYFAKNPAKRIPIFTRLAQKHPDDAGVVYHMAFALNDVGRDDEGLKLLEAQRAKYPQSSMVAFRMAQYHLAGGKKDAAVAAALEAAKLCVAAPDRAVYDELDRILVKTTQLTPDQRDKIWTELVPAFPREVNAPNNAGIWFRDQAGDPANCLKWFLKALQIAPEDVMLLNDVAIAYQSSAEPDLDKSEAYFRQAITVAKKNKLDRADRSKGYTLAVDNLVKLLASQKRVKDLLALSKEIGADPRSESIRQLAASLQR